jgi:phosphoribosylamine--glycine ligase
MNVLILGSGGREHAFAWKISQSSLIKNIYIAPGNAGTEAFGTNLPIDPTDFKAIKKAVIEHGIKMVIVGPEDPLVKGIVEFFEKDKALTGVSVIGPNSVAAQLEGSKDFAKQFMVKHGIPTAKYASFTNATLKEGQAFLETLKAPYVLKASGLAAGKGVVILEDLAQAKKELKAMLSDKKFGEASSTVVIEEFLKGIECSIFIMTDGNNYKVLPEAKDYKRIGEGDMGLNTGGMGAVSPVPFCTPEFIDKIEAQIIIPTMKGLKADGIDYRGFIFFGIIKVGNEPYVIEYNCRMGDPETEVVIPRIKSDLLHLFEGIATQTLGECDVQVDPRYCTTTMLVSKGYPESSEKGKEISNFEEVRDCIVFHAGTKKNGAKVVTNGGRVLTATAYGSSLHEAIGKSNEAADVISFSGKYFRKDIGNDLKKLIKEK